MMLSDSVKFYRALHSRKRNYERIVYRFAEQKDEFVILNQIRAYIINQREH